MGVNVRASTGCLFITDHHFYRGLRRLFLDVIKGLPPGWLIAVEIIPRIVRIVDTLKTT